MAVTFSDEAARKLSAIAERYPTRQAVVLPALHLAQKEFGHLHDDAIQCVAAFLDLPESHVHGVATFYTMLRRQAGATNTLRVCTNISCMLRGAYDVMARLEQVLGIKHGERTADEKFQLVEEECIAACANAPAIVCGTRYFLDVTPEQVESIIAELRERPHPESEVV